MENHLLVAGTALGLLSPCPPLNLFCIQLKNCMKKKKTIVSSQRRQSFPNKNTLKSLDDTHLHLRKEQKQKTDHNFSRRWISVDSRG